MVDSSFRNLYGKGCLTHKACTYTALSVTVYLDGTYMDSLQPECLYCYTNGVCVGKCIVLSCLSADSVTGSMLSCRDRWHNLSCFVCDKCIAMCVHWLCMSLMYKFAVDLSSLKCSCHLCLTVCLVLTVKFWRGAIFADAGFRFFIFEDWQVVLYC